MIVRWLTPAPLESAEKALPNLEAAWNRTLLRLGIDPVYPPEEDLVVGDLLATVIRDERDPNETKDNKLESSSPFLRRTVKIAHVDLRQQLGNIIANSASSRNGPIGVSLERKNPMSILIPINLLHSKLLAHSKPQNSGGKQRSCWHLSVRSSVGSTKFGASNQGVEELHLKEVRTYGLPSARAAEALLVYCTNAVTKGDCEEDTARKHLERYVGPRIYNQYADRDGNNVFGVKIEIALVNRVYLTKTIVHIRRIGTAQGGSFFAAKRSVKIKEQATPPSSSSPAADLDVKDVRKRLTDIEVHLSKLSPGDLIMFKIEVGTEIVLEKTSINR